MDAQDFKSVRERFGLSIMEWGRVLGYDGPRDSVQRTILNYESGRREIPGYIASLVIMYDRYNVPIDFLQDAGISLHGDEDANK